MKKRTEESQIELQEFLQFKFAEKYKRRVPDWIYFEPFVRVFVEPIAVYLLAAHQLAS